MKRKHFWEVEPEIRRFIKTCQRGKTAVCQQWGVDHWKDGRIFYTVWAKPEEDWIEIIEQVSHWRETPETLGLPIDEDDLEGLEKWPWS